MHTYMWACTHSIHTNTDTERKETIFKFYDINSIEVIVFATWKSLEKNVSKAMRFEKSGLMRASSILPGNMTDNDLVPGSYRLSSKLLSYIHLGSLYLA